MTSPSAVPPTHQETSDYYSALGPLLRMAWGDNFHFGYWEGPADTSSPQEATDRFTDLLAARLGVGRGDRVLDVGCGIGKPALRVAASTGARVLGITISHEQVEQATELAREEGMAEEVEFRYADGMDMPFQDASFDAVLAFESIVHMDRPTALREMARVLRPGGRLVVTDTFPVGDVPEGDARTSAGPVSSMGRIDDYPGLVAGAGLLLDELTDVTEHTRFTFHRMIDRIFRCRKEFERTHGVSLEELLETLRPAHPDVPVAGGTPQVGCLILVAHRP